MFKPFLFFLNLHFPKSGFNGRIQIGCRGRKTTRVLPALTCSLDDLFECFSSFCFDGFTDYYITANAFHGVRRVSEDLFSLHNLVIDIDCHTEGLSCDVDCYLDRFLRRLEHSVFDMDVMLPTTIVYTGRGLQLWWAIEGISSKFVGFYKEVLDYYIAVIGEVVDGYLVEEYSLLTVDASASRNLVGYFRCPFTFNTKAHRKATAIFYGTRYCLMDLYEKMKEVRTEDSRFFHLSRLESNKSSFAYQFHDFTEIASKRMRAIYLLRQVRDHEIGEEERNNLCFMLYNSLVTTSGHEIAYGEMERFNQGFKQPMSTNELNDTISSAKAKGGYQYSSEAFLKFLQASEEESSLIGISACDGFSYLSKKQVASFRSKKKKLDRDGEILDLFDDGVTATDISKQLSLSMPTIAKVLKTHGRSRVEYDKEAVVKLLQAGVSYADIVSQCGCSLRTVQRIARSNS